MYKVGLKEWFGINERMSKMWLFYKNVEIVVR